MPGSRKPLFKKAESLECFGRLRIVKRGSGPREVDYLA
jgi:hypothetical protein